MNRVNVLLPLVLLAGLSSTAAMAADAVSASQAARLQPAGSVHVQGIPGSPQRVEQLIAAKADAQHASYYRITSMQESQSKSSWRASATLYR